MCLGADGLPPPLPLPSLAGAAPLHHSHIWVSNSTAFIHGVYVGRVQDGMRRHCLDTAGWGGAGGRHVEATQGPPCTLSHMAYTAFHKPKAGLSDICNALGTFLEVTSACGMCKCHLREGWAVGGEGPAAKAEAPLAPLPRRSN